MAWGPGYRVPFRRRREGKTDYKLRRALVVSRLPRFVARSTLKHIIVQFIRAKPEGDEVYVSAHSSALKKLYGWKGACRNVPAAYLTGLLCGYRAKEKGIKTAILDIGLQTPSRGARVFASLQGVLDTGITIPHNTIVLPDEHRIMGQHISEYANRLLESETPRPFFSRYRSQGLAPQELPEHFSQIKEKIVASHGR